MLLFPYSLIISTRIFIILTFFYQVIILLMLFMWKCIPLSWIFLRLKLYCFIILRLFKKKCLRLIKSKTQLLIKKIISSNVYGSMEYLFSWVRWEVETKNSHTIINDYNINFLAYFSGGKFFANHWHNNIVISRKFVDLTLSFKDFQEKFKKNYNLYKVNEIESIIHITLR